MRAHVWLADKEEVLLVVPGAYAASDGGEALPGALSRLKEALSSKDD